MTEFEWRDLLPLAERLAGDADDEAAGRTAINRASYAAYHAAAAFARSTGLVRGRHTHAKVWTALVLDADAERAEIGRRGDFLRQVRIGADYRRPFPSDLAEQTRNAVAMARAIIEALDRMS